MSLRIVTFVLAVCAVLAPWALAESTDCAAPVLIIPDGRLTQSTFPPNATFWYGIYAQANHSYAVEFVPAADNYLNTTRPRFSSISIFGPSDVLVACAGTSSVAVTQNSGYSPVILKGTNGAGRRASFTAQSAGLYLMYVTNQVGGGTYTFRAVDTTVINVRWNTMNGNDVQWILMNISDMPVTGTMTIIDMNGQIIVAVPISLPVGGRVSRTSGSSDLRLARELAGSAVFSHNGPPGSIIAEAFLLTGTGSLVEKFEAVMPH